MKYAYAIFRIGLFALCFCPFGAYSQTAFLGIATQPVTAEVAKSAGLRRLQGALVTSVTQGGPADIAGIKPGDVITSFNGRGIGSDQDLLPLVAGISPGTNVTVQLWRNKKAAVASVKVGSIKSDTAAHSDPDVAQPTTSASQTVPATNARPAEPRLAQSNAVAPARTTEKRVALVIGNSAYAHTLQLANPRNDAQAITAALRRAGFDVHVVVDANKRAFEDALRRFGDRLDGAHAAVFFYAGHGVQVDGRNYLLPVDAKLERVRDLTYETIELSTVLREMEATRRVNLIFLDACRDNPMMRSLTGAAGARSVVVGRGLAPVDAATGTLISYATKDGNVAADGVGRNSPYTTALLSQLEQPGLEVGLMLRRVRENVIAMTNNQQVPWEYGSLLGEFYFRPRD